jgi:hypothetical protein
MGLVIIWLEANAKVLISRFIMKRLQIEGMFVFCG